MRGAGARAKPQVPNGEVRAGLNLNVGMDMAKAHRMRFSVLEVPVEAGRVEQVLEQPVDGRAGLDDARGQLFHLRRVLRQHVGVQPHRVHRLANVVRGHGQKAPAAQGRVFDDFFKAHTHVGTQDGFGLGLAIVQQLARQLGCSVALRSQEGRGTLLRVTLPAVEAALPLGAGFKEKTAPALDWQARAAI